MSRQLSAIAPEMRTRTNPDALRGVRFSAVILAIVACAMALIAIVSLVAFSIFLSGHGIARVYSWFAALLLVSLGFEIAACFLLLRAAAALHNSRRWAANVAMVCGGILVAFGCIAAADFLHVTRAAADEYFLYPIAPLSIVLGAWLSVYLALPSVRFTLRGRSE